MDPLVPFLTGILPVLALLLVLVALDSYKLIRPTRILLAILMGSVVAGASYLLNRELIGWTGMELQPFARYVAPVVEEIGKAILIVILVRGHRLAFLVDAAIFGFAIGTGFAVVENVYYAQALSGSGAGVWLVRGFGTAIMHGSTTAIVAIVARKLADRGAGAPLGARASGPHSLICGPEVRVPRGPEADQRAAGSRPERAAGSGLAGDRHADAPGLAIFVPGLLLGVAVHSLFNHFLLSPILQTAGVLIALPPLFFVVFSRSEASLRQWLDVGFDADTELLELIHSGELSRSRVGLYLQSLKERFHGPVVADMLCYLRLHVELALRAKGLLMMRESGFKVPLDPEVEARLAELRYLEGSIGRTGKLAMAPFLHAGAREIWQLSMLKK